MSHKARKSGQAGSHHQDSK